MVCWIVLDVVWILKYWNIENAVFNIELNGSRLQCNISMSNCSIVFKFDIGVKYLKLDTKMCQWLDKWLDKHPKGIVTTICIPHLWNSIPSNECTCPIALK